MSEVLKKAGSCVMDMLRLFLPTIAGHILSVLCFFIICVNTFVVFIVKHMFFECCCNI